jgi:outer membrane protein assembly factor BamB
MKTQYSLAWFGSLSLAAASALSLLAVTAGAADVSTDAKQFWPQWRGPLGSGVAPLADPPLTWSETNNVKWKVKVPGSGNATPVVWGDRVFVLAAVPTGKKTSATDIPAATNPNLTGSGGGRQSGVGGTTPSGEIYQFLVLCYDRNTGQILWQKTAREAVPHEGHHADNGYASGSPVTDGELVFAHFGSWGLHCYDLQGNLQWSKDFGKMQTRMAFGEGASPALYGDKIVVYWDDERDNDFIAAFDKRSGKELWRTPRNEQTGWSTPLIAEYGGQAQVVVNAERKVRSYDLATGKELWNCGGQGANTIPSPVASADTVYVTSGFQRNALVAIALGRTGDLTGTDAVRWSRNRNTPYSPSPLLVDDFLYVVTVNNNVISCLDAKTGTPHFEGTRLDDIGIGIYASPVSAKDRVYVLGRDGTCVVLKKAPTFEILARNKLKDKPTASIALAGGDLFIRGYENLYCIAQASPPK